MQSKGAYQYDPLYGIENYFYQRKMVTNITQEEYNDYTSSESAESAEFFPETPVENQKWQASNALTIDSRLSILTGIPESSTASIKLPKNQNEDFTIHYSKKPKDGVCSFKKITIALVLIESNKGDKSCIIRASYELYSHNERSPSPREPGRKAQTQFALYSANHERIDVIPTFPDAFWLKCGTNGHLRTINQPILLPYFEATEYIYLWITSGEFYKC